MKLLKFVCVLALLVLGSMFVRAQDTGSPVAVTLERTACFGTCPIYTVTILEDGTVLYHGEDFVQTTGDQTYTIEPEAVQALVNGIAEAGYFDWDEAYDTMTVTDMPSVITSVTRDGETHRITRYAGDDSAPLALPFIEYWIDAVANTGMWTGAQQNLAAMSYGTNTPLVTMEQTACFGMCPVYVTALFEDGTVVFIGLNNVKEMGLRIFQVEPASITSIAQRAEGVGYFDWQDEYLYQAITDQSTIITSVRWNDNFKRITRYGGDPNAPVGLTWIEDAIALTVADQVE